MCPKLAAEDSILFYGDNLDVLGRHVPEESVDLVYLDPPFNSNQDYNVLFAEKNGSASTAQIQVFEDTWQWDLNAARAFQDVVEGGGRAADALHAFRSFLGDSDMMAYLAMMAPRLVALRRAMKNSASIFLHCDPTASHYLKMLMDAVFGPEQFRNEIVWRRTAAHNKMKRCAPIHDIILFYSKTHDYKWKYPKRPYMKGHVADYFVEENGRYRTNYYGNVLTGSGIRGGESGKPWHGFDPSAKNRHWAIPGALIRDLDIDVAGLSQHQTLDLLLELGHVKITEGQAWPMYERYITANDGQPISDMWAFQPYTNGTVFGTEGGIDDDVRWLSPRDQERLGYPTQKPEGLLERIIRATTDEGDLVLDPFCGCGTTICVAQKLHRRWIGIDITHLAVALIKHRLADMFGVDARYTVTGEPVTLSGAEELASEDPYQFQWWALGRVNARPAEGKKGADHGIDGRLYFHDEGPQGKTKQVVFSVKAGKTNVSHVRDLRGVLEREKATIGVLISMQETTKPMRQEAANAGFYESRWGQHPRIQLLTIEALLGGARVDMPMVSGSNVTFKKAAKDNPKKRKGPSLF